MTVLSIALFRTYGTHHIAAYPSFTLNEIVHLRGSHHVTLDLNNLSIQQEYM